MRLTNKLYETVVQQIIQDYQLNQCESIERLFNSIPEINLLNFLPEDYARDE